MNTIEAINKALPIFLQHGSFEDVELLNVFIKKDFALEIARKIVVFMPIAFGRTLMKELRVTTSDDFEVAEFVNNSLRKQKRRLNDVEIYREAFKLASSMSAKNLRNEEFWAVANRSAEVGVVNQLKLEGSSPENLVLTSMITMWEIEEEPPYISTESTQTIITESAEKKWWEFWK